LFKIYKTHTTELGRFNFESALEVWDKTVSSDLLTEPTPVPITLVLNKVDLFRKDLLNHRAGFHETHTEVKNKAPGESEDDYENRCIEAVRKVRINARFCFCCDCAAVTYSLIRAFPSLRNSRTVINAAHTLTLLTCRSRGTSRKQQTAQW
jgi:GTPase SAR1 family protein